MLALKTKLKQCLPNLRSYLLCRKNAFLLFPHLMNFLGLPRLREWLYSLQMVENTVFSRRWMIENKSLLAVIYCSFFRGHSLAACLVIGDSSKMLPCCVLLGLGMMRWGGMGFGEMECALEWRCRSTACCLSFCSLWWLLLSMAYWMRDQLVMSSYMSCLISYQSSRYFCSVRGNWPSFLGQILRKLRQLPLTEYLGTKFVVQTAFQSWRQIDSQKPYVRMHVSISVYFPEKCAVCIFSQEVLSPRMKFNVVFNRKVSDGWLHFRNSYVKGISFNRAANKQWSKPKWGQFTCLGVGMAQIVTGISEKLAFYISVSQAWMWRWKGIILWFGTDSSLMLIILQLPLSTICCIPTSALMEALLHSRSPPPPLHQLTFCPQLWFGYNSLQICCAAVYIFCSKHLQLKPLLQLAGTLFCWNLESLCRHLLTPKLTAAVTKAPIVACSNHGISRVGRDP